MALGPLRLSQSSYDLSETDSQVAVSVPASFSAPPPRLADQLVGDLLGRMLSEDEPRWLLAKSRACLAEEQRAKRVALALAKADADADEAESESTSTPPPTSTATASSTPTLRNRSTPVPPSSLPPPSSSAFAAPPPPPRPTSRPPIQQFSAMPPTALVSAQKEFAAAVKAAVEVARTKERVGVVGEKVREARARVEVAQAEAGKGKPGRGKGKGRK